MRILVAGATGYVGSRLVPALLDHGHEVVAASSSPPDPARFSWGESVAWERLDLTRESAVAEVVRDVDAVCYLVHSLDRPGFAAHDRRAAETMAAAVDAGGVRRLVYLSGLVPDVPRSRLSGHIASRLEVEEVLAQSSASTLSLRAGIVLGAGSTSFEIMRQLAAVSLVQPLPRWMDSLVQPVSVADVLRLLVAALEDDRVAEYADVGGPDVLSYAQLLALYCEVAQLTRLRFTSPPLPASAVAGAAGLMCAAPFRTVGALLASLRHDMVCLHGPEGLVDGPLLSAQEAIERSLVHRFPVTSTAADPHWQLRSDAAWTIALTPAERLTGVLVPMPETVRAVLHATEHRLRGLLSLSVPSSGQ